MDNILVTVYFVVLSLMLAAAVAGFSLLFVWTTRYEVSESENLDGE